MVDKFMLSGLYHKSIGRLLECVRLYRLNLTGYAKLDVPVISEGFEFMLPDISNIEQLRVHYQAIPGKIDRVIKRLESDDYRCFAYMESGNGQIAYTRWLCYREFFSAELRETLRFSDKEVLTLDSYTAPDYRHSGLHHAMNIAMLNWLKDNTGIQFVYMVIKCFIPHLTKIPLELGYRPISTKVYTKKGSFTELIKLVTGKIKSKHEKV